MQRHGGGEGSVLASSSSLASAHAADGFRYDPPLHGLGQVEVHPGEDGPARLLLHGVRGQGDDRGADPAAALRLADAPRRLVAVHHGHLASKKEQVPVVISEHLNGKHGDQQVI